MKESEWLTSTDPRAMLRHLHLNKWKPSDRKLRLFAVACCRQVWDKLTDDAPCGQCEGMGSRGRFVPGKELSPPSGYERVMVMQDCPDCHGTGRINRSRRAVEVAERYADGEATAEEARSADRDAAVPSGLSFDSPAWLAHLTLLTSASECAWDASRTHTLFAFPDQFDARKIQAALLREIFGNPYRPVTLCGGREFPCSFCGGSGESFEVDAVRFENGKRILDNPRPVACMCCDGSGTQTHDTESPCPLCKSIRTTTVLRVARDIYDSRRFEELPVLADALTEAGCADYHLLNHLRGLELTEIIHHPEGCDEETWRPLRGPHVRGCWALDTILGRE